MSVFNSNMKVFPDGPVVKNLPSNGDEGAWGSIPGQGTQIPHPAGQQSPRTATAEPARSGAGALQLRPDAVK